MSSNVVNTNGESDAAERAPQGAAGGSLPTVCFSCHLEVPDDVRLDNRYRGCALCGWVMHHGCWIEHLTDGTLPCPTVVEVVAPVFFKNGRLKSAGYEMVEYPEGHGDVIGMRSEWGPLG